MSIHLAISTDLLYFAGVMIALTLSAWKLEIVECKSPLCLDVSTFYSLNEIKSTFGIMDVHVWVADNIMKWPVEYYLLKHQSLSQKHLLTCVPLSFVCRYYWTGTKFLSRGAFLVVCNMIKHNFSWLHFRASWWLFALC